MERREQLIRRQAKTGVKNGSQSPGLGHEKDMKQEDKRRPGSKRDSRSQGSSRTTKEDWKLEVGRVLRQSERSIA